MSVYETPTETSTESEHATVTESAPRWKGPFTERGPRGEPTGARFVRCSACGVEVLDGDTEHATHRDGCDGVEPTRSEPAGFGGGETTGVQEL